MNKKKIVYQISNYVELKKKSILFIIDEKLISEIRQNKLVYKEKLVSLMDGYYHTEAMLSFNSEYINLCLKVLLLGTSTKRLNNNGG
jgi:hypothetical protein